MAAIQDGANKTQTSVQGLTGMEKLLMDSVLEGKLELVKKILDKGASVNTAEEVREQSRMQADSHISRSVSDIFCLIFVTFCHLEEIRSSDRF